MLNILFGVVRERYYFDRQENSGKNFLSFILELNFLSSST